MCCVVLMISSCATLLIVEECSSRLEAKLLFKECSIRSLDSPPPRKGSMAGWAYTTAVYAPRRTTSFSLSEQLTAENAESNLMAHRVPLVAVNTMDEWEGGLQSGNSKENSEDGSKQTKMARLVSGGQR